MKVQKVFLLAFVPVALTVAGLFICRPLNADEDALKRACIDATVRAISMEIRNYEQKLLAAQCGPGNPANVPVFRNRLSELNTELTRFRGMKPKDYTLPEKKTVAVLVNQALQDGSLLEIDDMTKSGPFYHLAGISGDDYGALKTGRKYTMTIYPVYKKDYVLPLAVSYYVYACGFTPSISLNPRQPGEEVLKELVAGSHTVAIRVGSNGCTDKDSFRVDVQKSHGVSPKTPHYVLTFFRVKPDECKAIVPGGTLITFDLKKNLGLGGAYTYSVSNRVGALSGQ